MAFPLTTTPLQQPSNHRPESRLPILALHGVNTLFTRVYHNLAIVRPSNLPEDGPAILVSNHISGLDPLLIQSACRSRLITWMMASEYMDLPGLGRVFRMLGVIPVQRGSRETGPLRQALRQLHQGRVIGLFPEGRISTTGEMLDFQSGAGLMALRTGAMVYPVYLDGTQRNKEMSEAFFRRQHAFIAFGEPLHFCGETSTAALDEVTQRIKSSLTELRMCVDTFRNVR